MSKKERFLDMMKVATIVYTTKAKDDAKGSIFRAVELLEEAMRVSDSIPESITAGEAVIKYFDFHVREEAKEFDESYSWLCSED